MTLRERLREAISRALVISGGLVFGYSMIPLLRHFGVVGSILVMK